jgi:hypothetical protein
MQNVYKNLMKSTKWVAFMAAVTIPLLSGYAQVPPAGAANISPNAAEVIKLASSGVGDDVVLAFVQNSQAPFDLTADNVLYLRDLGVSQPVITAMLNHDSAFRAQAPQETQPPYAPTPAQVAPAPAMAPTPAPEAPPPQAAPAPASYVGSPPPDVSYFYNDLAPYGSWVSLPGVGWCWQPSVVVVNRGWRPYCDSGHWVYTDDGWFWQSDYSWGWAPFHYGRWYMDASCGWVWLPGREWGPAWVTWRTAGTTCGWAPLPPGADFVAGIGWRWRGLTVGASFDFGLGVNAFAFVSFGNLCAHDVAYRCLPRAQTTVIFKQTTVVNNYTVVNHTYVNHGISVDRIAAASHTPIPRATVHEGHPGTGRPAGGATAVVYKAPLKAPEKPVHMLAQKVDPVHPVIQHQTATMVSTQQKSSFGGSTPSSTVQRTANPALRNEQRSSVNGSTPTTTWQHAPNTQVKSEQTVPLGSSTQGSTAAGSTKYQSGGVETHQWQPSAKPAASAQTFSAPQSQQSQTLKQENRSVASPKPSATANPNAPSTTSKGQSTWTTESYKGATHSSGSTGQAQPAPSQAVRESGSSHFYNPKTVEQASQVKSIYQQPKGSSVVPPANSYQPGSKKNQ